MAAGSKFQSSKSASDLHSVEQHLERFFFYRLYQECAHAWKDLLDQLASSWTVLQNAVTLVDAST